MSWGSHRHREDQIPPSVLKMSPCIASATSRYAAVRYVCPLGVCWWFSRE